MPTVSILLPVFNAIDDLPRSMNSLLNQTYPDFEIIALDDGSVDGSGEMLDSYAQADKRIRVFHENNAGALGITLNKAMEHARGKYLARQDADDASHPTRLAEQVKYLDSKPQIGLCGSWTWFIDSSLGPLFSLELPDDPARLTGYLEKGMNPFVHGSIMGRSELFHKTGGYRGSFAEDFDLWLRMSEITRLGMCRNLGYYYWRSIGGISAGAHTRQIKLIKLFLKLKSERVRYSKEISKWEDEYTNIANMPSIETIADERQASMHYSRAIQLLRRRIFMAAKNELALATAGQGVYAQKARRNLHFFGLAPLLSAVYHLLESREPFYFSRTLPNGTQIPTFNLPPGT